MNEILLICIIVLVVLIIRNKFIIYKLRCELEEKNKQYLYINNEYKFYYQLSEKLWDAYRTYEIFPTSTVRALNEHINKFG